MKRLIIVLAVVLLLSCVFAQPAQAAPPVRDSGTTTTVEQLYDSVYYFGTLDYKQQSVENDGGADPYKYQTVLTWYDKNIDTGQILAQGTMSTTLHIIYKDGVPSVVVDRKESSGNYDTMIIDWTTILVTTDGQLRVDHVWANGEKVR